MNIRNCPIQLASTHRYKHMMEEEHCLHDLHMMYAASPVLSGSGSGTTGSSAAEPLGSASALGGLGWALPLGLIEYIHTTAYTTASTAPLRMADGLCSGTGSTRAGVFKHGNIIIAHLEHEIFLI